MIFHDVNAIILILICEVMITIAWKDAARLEEHNDVWCVMLSLRAVTLAPSKVVSRKRAYV